MRNFEGDKEVDDLLLFLSSRRHQGQSQVWCQADLVLCHFAAAEVIPQLHCPEPISYSSSRSDHVHLTGSEITRISGIVPVTCNALAKE